MANTHARSANKTGMASKCLGGCVLPNNNSSLVFRTLSSSALWFVCAYMTSISFINNSCNTLPQESAHSLCRQWVCKYVASHLTKAGHHSTQFCPVQSNVLWLFSAVNAYAVSLPSYLLTCFHAFFCNFCANFLLLLIFVQQVKPHQRRTDFGVVCQRCSTTRSLYIGRT